MNTRFTFGQRVYDKKERLIGAVAQQQDGRIHVSHTRYKMDVGYEVWYYESDNMVEELTLINALTGYFNALKWRIICTIVASLK